MSNEVKNFEFEGGLKKLSLGLVLLGVIGFIASFGINKTIGWVDFTVSNLYFVTMAASAIFFLALTGVTQASWLTPYKRIPEAMTKYLPVSFITMAIGYFGLHTVYEWTHKDVVMADPILSQKVAWLNEPRFLITMALILIVWMILARKLRAKSEEMDDKVNGVTAAHSAVGLSAISIILFSLTICVAAFDWIMSVEPHWFSTIFGVYVFAGAFVAGISFVALAVLFLRDNGYFENIITDDHLHDIAKWMFAMSVFWAYIWVSQYLLIWYANIPEETEYYVLRHHHWNGVFFFNLIINFIVPFFALMTRAAKRSATRVKIVAFVLLFGHFVDLYLMVAPKVFEEHQIHHIPGVGILQVLQLLGGFGLFIYIVANNLSKRKLVPTNDPTFSEGLHLHQ